MSFLDISQRYLKRLEVPFEVIAHKAVESTFEVPSVAGVPAKQLVKTVLLADDRGAMLVSLAADQGLDFEALNTQLKRRLTLAHAKQFHENLLGFAPIMLPPWHRMYELPWVVEHSLCEQPVLYLASGSPKAIIRIEREAFLRLSSDALISHFGRQSRNFSQEAQQVPLVDVQDRVGASAFSAPDSLRERLAQGIKLPIMPGLAAELVALKSDAHRDVIRASRLIEQDPVLSANLLRYAASPFFAYQGSMHSIQEAIHHVLGLDQALDLAVGLSLCSYFRGPREGRLGLGSLWRDAFFSASTCQLLASHSSLPALNERVGQVFLAGLLHNVGYLVLAQLFPTEYALFNRLVTQQQGAIVTDLEARTLGISHAETGKTLLAAWKLDELLQSCALAHHELEYQGAHQEFVRLVGISDLLLAQQGFGDMPALDVPQESLSLCGLDHAALQLAQSQMLVQQEDLGHLVSRVLAA